MLRDGVLAELRASPMPRFRLVADELERNTFPHASADMIRHVLLAIASEQKARASAVRVARFAAGVGRQR